MEDASPSKDGWMLSDFFLLNHMFADAPGTNINNCYEIIWADIESTTSGSIDKRFTSCPPRDLHTLHHRYLHGNPYSERRVVLGDGVPDPKNLVVVTQNTLKQAFLNEVDRTFRTAHRNGEQVMVVLVGHGMENGNFVIGPEPEEDDPDLRKRITKREIADLRVNYPGLKVSILLTSCFSGSWCSPSMTVLAAAGPGDESIAWWSRPGSPVSRACGGIYSSAVASQLLSEERLNREEWEEEQGPSSRTAGEFWRGLRIKLAWLDRLHERHNITFSVEGDAMLAHWRDLIHLPLDDVTERLRVLPKFWLSPPPPPNPDRNRSTRNEEQEAAFQAFQASVNSERLLGGGAPLDFFAEDATAGEVLSASIRLRAPGSETAMRHALRREARQYLESGPGPDNTSANTGVHIQVHDCLSKRPMALQDLEALHNKLEYRIELNEACVHYLSVIEVDPVCTFKTFTSQLYNSIGRTAERELAETHLRNINIFPQPTRSQGAHYFKPSFFFVASLLKARIYGKNFVAKVNEVKNYQSAEAVQMVGQIRSLSQGSQLLLPAPSSKVPKLAPTVARTSSSSPWTHVSLSSSLSNYLRLRAISGISATRRALSPVKKSRPSTGSSSGPSHRHSKSLPEAALAHRPAASQGHKRGKSEYQKAPDS